MDSHKHGEKFGKVVNRAVLPALAFTIAGGLIVLFPLGCAQTSVQTVQEYRGEEPLPKPDMVLVYNFAASPDEVTLDTGISAQLVDLVKGNPSRTQKEREIGRKVADALSQALVDKINELGFAAERGSGPPVSPRNTLLIEGQFVSIDEGNQTARVIIGLGAGRTEVKTYVQVYEVTPQGRRLLEEFETDAKSGRKPGMAETMGAGAAMGHVATSAVLSTGLAAASETFGANVEADAERTAKEVANKLSEFFERQGWR